MLISALLQICNEGFDAMGMFKCPKRGKPFPFKIRSSSIEGECVCPFLNVVGNNEDLLAECYLPFSKVVGNWEELLA
jgi:hypothetical protein